MTDAKLFVIAELRALMRAELEADIKEMAESREHFQKLVDDRPVPDREAEVEDAAGGTEFGRFKGDGA